MRQIYHLLLSMSQYNENMITIIETMNVKSFKIISYRHGN